MANPRNQWYTLAASAARTATDTFEAQNYHGRYLTVVIDVTAVAATPSVVFTIQGVDPLSAKAYTLLASAAVTATGTTVLHVGPGLTAAANAVANLPVPYNWQLLATHADADSITYSVGYALGV